MSKDKLGGPRKGIELQKRYTVGSRSAARNNMRTYDQVINELADPEIFTPEVFVGDERFPQSVCDFMLALALVFNDFKDLFASQEMMQGIAPGDGPPTAARGMFGGLHVHWVRLLAGVIHELTELIAKNKTVIDSAAFRKILKRLPRTAREMWASVVASATSSGPRGDRFGRLVYYTRMKVGFHYDTKEIARGYRNRFLPASSDPPYISRGKNMAATRFYFADAAAEMYMMEKAGASTGKEFFTAGWKLLPEIGHALREIVTTFIALRNSQLSKRQATQ